MSDPATIRRELEKARKQLLDLTTRNRLLNIPQHDRAVLIRIADELSDEVVKRLVREKRRFTFQERSESSGSEEALDPPEPGEDDVDENGVAARHRDSKLQTSLTSDVLQKRLLSFYLDARTAIEEQGVNTLFLAIGQLKWREEQHSDLDRYAPLLLIPVELVRSSAKDRFHLVALEQEPSDNLSLLAKLREFGITGPEFEWTDDLLPSEYFQRITEAVAGQDGWEVLPDKMVLGFFSFAKFLMYRDLDPENWPEHRRLEEHPLVGGLIGSGFPASESRFPDDANLDELVPVERLSHVVDSDSSQALAVEEVRADQHLIIQGPPGTGKSQTITNLLATAVLDGKKVLFVAEKLAALEVVQRRMETIGLGPLVLELHSHKANKRTVLEELKRTLELGRPRSQDRENLQKRLIDLRTRLNGHAARLNDRLEPSTVTPIQILGRLSLLEGTLLPTENLPELDNPESWSPGERSQRELLVRELLGRLESMGPPTQHPWRGVERTVLTLFDAEEIGRAVRDLVAAFADLEQKAGALADSLHLPPPETMEDVANYETLARLIVAAPEVDPEAMTDARWNDSVDQLRSLVEAGRQWVELRRDYKDRVIDAAWTTDLTQVRLTIAAHGGSFFRFLNGDYRRAMSEFRSILKSPKPPGDLETRLRWIDDLLLARKSETALAEGDELAKTCWGSLWKGTASDWAQLESVVDWVASVHQAGFQEDFFKIFQAVDNPSNCEAPRAAARAAAATAEEQFDRVGKALELNRETAFGKSDCRGLPFRDLIQRFRDWETNPEALSSWVKYRHNVEQARELGIGGLPEAVFDGQIEPTQIGIAFELAYYRQMYRQVLETYPELARFDGQSHDQLVEEFRRRDRERIELARYETLEKHYEGMPIGGGMGAVGLLKGEMNKKRGHMAIRQLLHRTGSAVQAIKPVFMMSPLSVAQFLEPGAVEFDLVVFDEASQVEPVDALGAIARARQVVVVGDDKQLPPSQFFTRMAVEEEGNETDDEGESVVSAGDLESVLGLAHTKGLRSKMLRWHYRSRHESLIRVSNYEFYENNLFIIPSPHNRDEDVGLQFHYVENGVFDRGRSHKNVEEAKAVARAVIEHALENPGRSLGVAAFSVSQRDAIIDELELLRKAQPEAEPFFNRNPHEPFFVKNLENVQGDERDVVFISVGYAKDESGFFGMNFGPLNRDGGERRLNVLISRAKQRCVVFSSITSGDIDLNRSRARGVAALKTFLKFAETGILGIPDPETDREVESPFEESVKRAVEGEGYTVHPQVGSNGFYVDLAVVHPDRPGKYVLGIECDGAGYHSARSARERDRQRQAVLENHGWTIHRIWSSDWFQRPKEQLRRLVEAIETAKTEVGTTSTRDTTEDLSPRIRRAKSVGIDGETQARGEPYKEASIDITNTSKEIHELTVIQLAKLTMRVIKIEAPVHREEVIARLREAWGLGRAGRRVQEAVEDALNHLSQQNEIRIEDDFLFIPDQEVFVRDRGEADSPTLKKPERLPPAEIGLAIEQLLETNHGVEPEAVAVGVARLFGFKSTSRQLREIIEKEIERMRNNGRLKNEGHLLKLTEDSKED